MTNRTRVKLQKYTLSQFKSDFPDDDAILEWLKDYRWPDGIHCPVCDKVRKHHRIKSRPCYKCDNCGHEVYPTANTIFHKSATPLTTWFDAMLWMATTRSGHSAKELQRITGVTYKTAWRMFKQIRTLFGEDTIPLNGQVEVDESYFGGVRRGKRGRGAEGKTAVIGIVQRQGRVAASVVSNVKSSTVMSLIRRNVARAAIVYTDEFHSYDRVVMAGYRHKRVQHSAKVYVNGDAHTNSIEGFWSLAKRGISGVYHAVSPKYLQSYLNEYAFRYNHRNDAIPMFKLILKRI
ncbi:MAG: IS1595 family transposase [Dehalococcoidia bacterium]|nr:IS1595 family transposase [Dehalococcoidia bacterium]